MDTHSLHRVTKRLPTSSRQPVLRHCVRVTRAPEGHGSETAQDQEHGGWFEYRSQAPEEPVRMAKQILKDRPQIRRLFIQPVEKEDGGVG